MSLTKIYYFERVIQGMKNYVKNYKIRKGKIILNLEIRGIPLTTNYFPGVRQALRKNLPSIFKNKCFNSNNLSFFRESKNTELGHLFEHILLEYMCLTKIPYVDSISYSGRTYWNSKNPDGDFKVEICCDLVDWPIFYKALRKSMVLMNKILFPKTTFTRRGQFVVQTTPTHTEKVEN